MFDSVIFRRQRRFDAKNPLDLGSLMESLIFYQSVTLLADKSVLEQLVLQCGYNFVLELVENGFLKIEYLGNGEGIQTENTGTLHEKHNPILYSLPVWDFDNAARDIFVKATGKQGKGRRLANRFERSVNVLETNADVINDIRDDFDNPQYVEESVREILRVYTPEFSDIEKVKFNIYKNVGGLVVDTNINYTTLNNVYNARIPKTHSTMSNAYLLSHLFHVRSDMHFASMFGSEIATDNVSSKLLSLKIEELIEKRTTSTEKMENFRNFVLDDARDIGEVLANGDRSYEEFLEILEKAKRFQGWLKEKDPDVDLLREYHHAVVKDTWADKLPFKSSRWAIFTGVGMGVDLLGAGGLGTAAGATISAADTFLLDKFVGGWKPNHFVKELGDFVKIDSDQ